MQRTVYDLRVDAANIERQIAEKQFEVNTLQAKLAELQVEYQRGMESVAMKQRDEAHEKIKEQMVTQETPPVSAPAAEQPVAMV